MERHTQVFIGEITWWLGFALKYSRDGRMGDDIDESKLIMLNFNSLYYFFHRIASTNIFTEREFAIAFSPKLIVS